MVKRTKPKPRKPVKPSVTLAKRPPAAVVEASEDETQASPFDRLTILQRRFLEHYATHGRMREAARAAGYSGSDATVATAASVAMRHPDMQAALEAMLESDPLVVGRVERLRLRTEIARDKKQQPFARLAALDALDKLDGKLIDRLHVTGGLHLELENMSSEQLRKVVEEPDVVD